MQAAEEEHLKIVTSKEGRYTEARAFTKIIAQNDRIQFQWSHPSKIALKTVTGGPDEPGTPTDLSDLQYILEYGCGIKFKGVEQFRKIYQGKAHKCIVADLMPNTTYRFRVRPIRIEIDDNPDDGSKQIRVIEKGQWSKIVGVTTLEKE